MRGVTASEQTSEEAVYAPGTARPRSVNVGRSECLEAQVEVEKRTERKINNKKQENGNSGEAEGSVAQTLEQGRSTNLASKAVTAAGWLADRCFKAASKAGLGLAVGAGVSAAVLYGLTGLARASAAAASAVWGTVDEPVAEHEAARDSASGLRDNSSTAEAVRVRAGERA